MGQWSTLTQGAGNVKSQVSSISSAYANQFSALEDQATAAAEAFAAQYCKDAKFTPCESAPVLGGGRGLPRSKLGSGEGQQAEWSLLQEPGRNPQRLLTAPTATRLVCSQEDPRQVRRPRLCRPVLLRQVRLQRDRGAR